jgi:hypothetical protein
MEDAQSMDSSAFVNGYLKLAQPLRVPGWRLGDILEQVHESLRPVDMSLGDNR